MFNSSTEMEVDMEQHCRGNCFAIHFHELSDPMAGGRFKYSLSSNRMRISPKKRFKNDEEINHQIGVYCVSIYFGLLSRTYTFVLQTTMNISGKISLRCSLFLIDNIWVTLKLMLIINCYSTRCPIWKLQSPTVTV